MFAAAEPAFFNVVRKVLGNLLVVKPEDVKGKLHSSKKGNLKLQHAKVKERNFRLRRGTTFLRLDGSVNSIELLWDFTSSNGYGTLELTLHGLRLNLSFYEGEELPDTTKKELFIEESEYLFSLLQEEWKTFRQMVATKLRESNLVQETIQNILDPMSIRFVAPRFSIKVPVTEGEDSGSDSQRHSFVSIGADVIEMIPETLDGHKNFLGRKDLEAYIHVKALYVDLVENQMSPVPILKPWTYTVSARRTAGKRFINMARGYQMIGRDHEGTTSDAGHGKLQRHGLVVYVTSNRIQAIRTIITQFLKKKEDEKQQNDVNQNPKNSAMKSIRHFFVLPVVLPFAILLIGFLMIIVGAFYLNLITDNITMLTYVTTVAGVVFVAYPFCIPFVQSHVRKIGFHFYHTLEERKIYGKTDLPSATFRIPLPHASVVLGNGTTITLTKVAILGTMDRPNFIISSDQLDISSPETPRLFVADGVRATVIKADVQVNLDEIKRILIPHRVKSTKSITGAVFRLRDGVVDAELGEVMGLILQDDRKKKDEPMDNEQQTSNFVHSQEDLRWLVKEEIRRDVAELREIRIKFEKIQRKRNRTLFRCHDNSFRGFRAVDFMLASNIASSRHEAVRLGRQLQATFNLFRDVSSNNQKFADDFNCIYKFVDNCQLENWNETADPLSMDFIDIWRQQPLLPIRFVVVFEKLVLRHWKDQKVSLEVEEGQMFVTPGTLSRVLEWTFYMQHAKAQMFEVWNARINFMIHPRLCGVIHRFQFSMDAGRAIPGHSLEDWYEYFQPNFTLKEWWESFGLIAEDIEEKAVGPTRTVYFPFSYISEFKLDVGFNGVVVKTTLPSMQIERFDGVKDTCSMDLVKHLVMKMLMVTPQTIQRIPRSMVHNVRDKTAAMTKRVATNAFTGLLQARDYVGAVVSREDDKPPQVGRFMAPLLNVHEIRQNICVTPSNELKDKQSMPTDVSDNHSSTADDEINDQRLLKPVVGSVAH